MRSSNSPPVVSRFGRLFSRFGLNKFPIPAPRELARNGLILLPFLRAFCRGREKFPVEPGNRHYPGAGAAGNSGGRSVSVFWLAQ